MDKDDSASDIASIMTVDSAATLVDRVSSLIPSMSVQPPHEFLGRHERLRYNALGVWLSLPVAWLWPMRYSRYMECSYSTRQVYMSTPLYVRLFMGTFADDGYQGDTMLVRTLEEGNPDT